MNHRAASASPATSLPSAPTATSTFISVSATTTGAVTEFKKPSTPSSYQIACLTKYPLDLDSQEAKEWNWKEHINHSLTRYLTVDQQACILTILMEEYSVSGKISSYASGATSEFINFSMRAAMCPLCREFHHQGWSLSNAKKYTKTTLVHCLKTGLKALIVHKLPF